MIAGLVRWLIAIAALAVSAARAAEVARTPEFGPPVLAAGGSVRWSAPAVERPAWLAGLSLETRTTANAIAVWSEVATRDSLLRPYALREIARAKLASGDSAGADSALAEASEVPSLWQWPVLQARAELWRSRRGPAHADALLEAAGRAGWPDGDRAQWLAMRSALRDGMGDADQAITFARQVIRIHPSFPVARTAAASLEKLLRARRDSLSFADEIAAAEADRFAGQRPSAERRLARALRLAPPDERSITATRLAEFRRVLRRFPEAERAVGAALAAAQTPGQRAEALLERARLQQARGDIAGALPVFEQAATLADSSRAEALALEWAREAERAGAWSVARRALARAIETRSGRASGARFRMGLMHFTEGATDSAAAWWESDSSEAGRFWHAVALRALAGSRSGDRERLRARADSALRVIAARPGYTFHRSAARETLGLRGWPGAAVLEPSATPAAVHSARTLAALGLTADALSLLSRWNAGDPRLGAAGGSGASAGDRLAAAALAYALGGTALGIGIADRAARALEESGDARAWAAQPWLYPPGFESLARQRPAGLEPAMVLAITRQESRFDPRARSVSNALGLMQLKLPTARDVARRLRERVTLSEARLFEPARNLRYGAAYFEWLRVRFGGWPAVALSAYNAGPGTIPPHTPELLARGGEALFTEIASNATAQDYTRKILANRAAYRELAPRH